MRSRPLLRAALALLGLGLPAIGASQCTDADTSACTVGTPYCDVATGTCVACRSGADCATLACDLTAHSCASCSARAPCANPRPVCNANAVCEACSTDGQCAHWASGSFCALAAPLAGRCVQCTPSDLSRCGGSTPRCDPDTGSCVACATDADCSDVHLPVCDPDGKTCAPCAGDSGSGAPRSCPSPISPACQTSGALAGACTECSPTQRSSCTSDRPACLADSGTCGCAADGDCGAPGSGRTCSAGACVGGSDGGADGGHVDGNSGGGATEAISARGGGLSCGAAASSWSAAALVLAALSRWARRREGTRRA